MLLQRSATTQPLDAPCTTNLSGAPFSRMRAAQHPAPRARARQGVGLWRCAEATSNPDNAPPATVPTCLPGSWAGLLMGGRVMEVRRAFHRASVYHAQLRPALGDKE